MMQAPLRFSLFSHSLLFIFFFNDTAPTEIYTLSLHDALPILMPFVFGPMVDRWGGRPLAFMGLVCTAAWMPMMSLAVSFRSALLLIVIQWIAMALIEIGRAHV